MSLEVITTVAKFIPYAKHTIDAADVEAVTRVLQGEWLTQGPAVEEFEAALCRETGARHCVTFSSGTAALHGAYFAAGCEPGHEVLTTPLTFAATANGVLYTGARPVFVDVEPGTGNIDPEEVERAITSATLAVAAVDYTGHPAEMERLRALTSRHGILLIEDAAHAIGASVKGRSVGTLADLTVFSFHPTKHITTGEGGAVLTDDPMLHRRLQQFRTHGITRNPALLERKADGPWYQEMQLLGYNYRLSDMQAALGISQLGRLGRNISRRREIVERYNFAFANLPGVDVPKEKPGVFATYHLYVILLPPWYDLCRKAELVEALQRRGIGTQVHYPPVYRHPYYQRNGYANVRLPRAEEFYRRALSLPLFPALTDDEVDHVIDSIKTVLSDSD